ncbi:MAG: class I SAM-dependent DNA methyltransferase [Kiritimatiellae bacterium]|nr:class I SAM-dependent DNA methyltransferase [Kiritimatiellia bacterium]
MTPMSQREAAKAFADYWRGRGYEKGETQPFWIGLLRDVLGVDHPERGFIEFEDRAHIDSAHGFIDGYIPSTRVLIEQKSLGKSLRAGIPQSDGSVLTPFQQARRYCFDLPVSRHPRWIVTCNFAEFLVHDMERPNAEPESILLENLPDEAYRLSFLADRASEAVRREEEISKAAGEVVGAIHAALLARYRDPESPASLKSLNELCVRLVFLLYAEDAGVFPKHQQFHDYLARHRGRARAALLDLFKVLDTRPADRDPYLDADLAAFPHVNGGLFANADLEVPRFDDELLDLVLRKGSEDFDWSGISPVIFGAIFESTLNPATRRAGGMHYTSVANIHKVVDPLFLDDLTRRVDEALGGFPRAKSAKSAKDNPEETSRTSRTSREATLRALQSELASLAFLDPACGSGNFLTETYICLRRLENRIIAALQDGQGRFDLEGDTIRVSIRQFHGIEINDFAVKVAMTALWIAESQMLRETEALLHRNIDFLPLKTYDGIVEGNALRMDWASLAPHFDFVVGNPPFAGGRTMLAEKKEDVLSVFGRDWPAVGDLDYVCCWFKKAADCMAAHPATRAAFVATNSVTQGSAPANLWKPLFASGVSIDFAHRSFRWDSESNSKAHVHCVIVGFHCGDDPRAKSATSAKDNPEETSRTLRTSREEKLLFEGDRAQRVPHINAYLFAAPDFYVESVAETRCAAPGTGMGNQPIDGGHYLFTAGEKDAFLAKEPGAATFFRPWFGADELINGAPRYCLWLGDCEPDVLRALPECLKRVAAVREYRLASKRASTRRLADRPTRFQTENMPKGNCIVIPEVTSERRRYIPIGFLGPDALCSNKLRLVPDATLYHFGVLTSNVHMAWMRTVCGRLKSDYSYSVNIVYNNFPWPGAEKNPATPVHLCVPAPLRERIEQTAQAILDARAAHPASTLADLYDELTMPPDLRKAHQENDRAVMAAYGFPTKTTESECVAELFKRYQSLVATKKGQ